ncbi:MAG TPA: hypothetical protein VLM37_04265 [Fibrobacteraceae bacterium]|nr:hypothetical protein [Fibrobacteraceae bacterium]
MKPAFSSEALQRRIRQKVQGLPQDFRVVAHPGFEETVAEEIREILASSPSFQSDSLQTSLGGVEFSGRMEDLWRLHILARTPSRICLRIAQFKATQFPELVRKISQLPWELYMSPHAEGSIQVSAHHSRLIHSEAIEERVAAGIAQRLSPWRSVLPQPEKPLPAQTVFVRMADDFCSISLDGSGDLLFKRGYGKHTGAAPLRDTLAACILRWAGWSQCDRLVDPMSGSGTFSLEAFLERSADHIPGRMRSFAFEGWPCFRPATYQYLLSHSAKFNHPLVAISAADSEAMAVRILRHNLATVGADGNIDVRQIDFFHDPEIQEPFCRTTCLVVLNPPYGIRLPQGQTAFYKAIGERLRLRYAGCRFAIICPSPEERDALGLRWEKQVLTRNGGLDVAVICGRLPEE